MKSLNQTPILISDEEYEQLNIEYELAKNRLHSALYNKELHKCELCENRGLLISYCKEGIIVRTHIIKDDWGRRSNELEFMSVCAECIEADSHPTLLRWKMENLNYSESEYNDALSNCKRMRKNQCNECGLEYSIIVDGGYMNVYVCDNGHKMKLINK